MHEEFFTAQCYRPVARPDWNKVRREAPSADLSDSDYSESSPPRLVYPTRINQPPWRIFWSPDKNRKPSERLLRGLCCWGFALLSLVRNLFAGFDEDAAL